MADKENAAVNETAEKKDKVEKKPAKSSKPGFFSRLAKWFKEARVELKKVTWPTWKQTMNNTLIVLAFCVVIGLCIFAFDKLADGILGALLNLFHPGA